MLGGDTLNALLLTLLYCLQGIPLGLGGASLPYLLKKHMSYNDLATFSLAMYPFSLKFFWSPLVDSYYFPLLGRRKSWIIPLQFCSGIAMLLLSYHIEDMILDNSYISTLTLYMFIIILLYATQDIAVDGWAIEILSDENKPLASSCQSIGQTIGFFMSFTILLSFNSLDFCNTYINSVPQTLPLLSVSSYIYFWGVVNLIVTGLLFFKHELPTKESFSVKEIYYKVYEYAKTEKFKYLLLILLTSRLGTSFNDSALLLVLSEKGLKESSFGFFAVIMLPIDIALCTLVGFLLKKYPNELRFYRVGLIFKVCACCWGLVLLQSYPGYPIPNYYYAMLFVGNIASSIAMDCMFVSICSFFNKIADIAIAGTILTFLNTLHNLGSSLPRYGVYKAIHYLSAPSICEESACEGCEIKCTEGRHGYYPLAAISLLFALFYIFWIKKIINKIEALYKKSD
ncbi:hypothetical protein SteCoe_21895 [Stentor coeruleus]|uniref:Major facilitator superfamily (MFS) profile domain-containing protein n=1 Tax=Stentor coeruleus TaxID=5963 RepID=A0A1R2BNF0_9CILI|nr:hypothetical protein SteCoe_21895 [Stentor coeruleus]